jgi:hypothetical protein
MIGKKEVKGLKDLEALAISLEPCLLPLISADIKIEFNGCL